MVVGQLFRVVNSHPILSHSWVVGSPHKTYAWSVRASLHRGRRPCSRTGRLHTVRQAPRDGRPGNQRKARSLRMQEKILHRKVAPSHRIMLDLFCVKFSAHYCGSHHSILNT